MPSPPEGPKGPRDRKRDNIGLGGGGSQALFTWTVQLLAHMPD